MSELNLVLCVCVFVRLCVCVCAFVCVSVRVCVCVCVRSWAHQPFVPGVCAAVGSTLPEISPPRSLVETRRLAMAAALAATAPRPISSRMRETLYQGISKEGGGR